MICVTYEALLVVVTMWAMWLTAPCLVRLQYMDRWTNIMGAAVFMLSFFMMLFNFTLWLFVMARLYVQT